jgi:hypothetical protein
MVTILRINTNETVKMNRLPQITTQLYTVYRNIAHQYGDKT